MPRKALTQVERYDISRSPFAQHPTQRDIAVLVGETRDDLRRLVNYKEMYIVRRVAETGKKKKVRQLAYPTDRLRRVHERLKFQLSKIKQPGYLFSPRKKRAPRDNAAYHIDQQQYLTLDLKQFYPSITGMMVKRWFMDHLGMAEDVAGLLMHLSTVDEKVSFGSPLTPVLSRLVHRPMFDAIAEICESKGLRYTVWVDDLTISGRFVPAEVLLQIREVIKEAGLKSHDIKYRYGTRPVYVTGIGIVGANLVAPNALHLRIRDEWANYHDATTDDERDCVCQQLLSLLGSLRYISGKKSAAGQKAAGQMNTLRQQRNERHRRLSALHQIEANERRKATPVAYADLPF